MASNDKLLKEIVGKPGNAEHLNIIARLNERIRLLIDKAKISPLIETAKISEMEWHLFGLTYHALRMCECYNVISNKLIEEYQKTKLDILYLKVQEARTILYEFYALLNLLRINLNNIQQLLAPLFKKNSLPLPNSIKDTWKRKSNCKILDELNQPIFHYIIDLRDCVVHFKSFSSMDYAIAINLGLSNEELETATPDTLKSVVRINFVIEDDKMLTRINLPDRIWSDDKKIIKQFTYKNNISMVSQCLKFVEATILYYKKCVDMWDSTKTDAFEFFK